MSDLFPNGSNKNNVCYAKTSIHIILLHYFSCFCQTWL